MAFREAPVQSHLIEIRARQRIYNIHMKQIRAAKTVLGTRLPEQVPRIRCHPQRLAMSLDMERQFDKENTRQFNAIEQSRSSIGRSAVYALTHHPLYCRGRIRKQRSDWLAIISGKGEERNNRPKTLLNA